METTKEPREKRYQISHLQQRTYFENAAKVVNQVPGAQESQRGRDPGSHSAGQAWAGPRPRPAEIPQKQQYFRQENNSLYPLQNSSKLETSVPTDLRSFGSSNIESMALQSQVHNTSELSMTEDLELLRGRLESMGVSQRQQQNNYEIETHDPRPTNFQANPLSDAPHESHQPSESSEDSFIQVERLKFYRNKVKEAIRSENWIEAKELQSCIFEILLRKDDRVGAEWYIDGAKISYMLGNLKEAKSLLESVPKSISIDPTTMLNSYSLESAILIRERDYDSAYTTSKKAAKLARKSNLPEYMYLAYYLLQRVFTARGDMKEADFYKQLIQPGFQLPSYVKILDDKAQDSLPTKVPTPSTSEPSRRASSVGGIPDTTPAPVQYQKEPVAEQTTVQSPLSAQIRNTNSMRLIVGVDFGTISSSVAWASLQDPDEISIIDIWPSMGIHPRDSVPSRISYLEGSTVNFNWGYDIPPTAKSFDWFKLLLESDDPYIREQVDLPPGLNPTDLVTDFLSGLYTFTMETLQMKKGPQYMRSVEIDFVFTVPTIWTKDTQLKIQRCAEDAGFSSGHKLTTISELEAVAIYIIGQCQLTLDPKIDQGIVVCSMSAGTVDLVTYKCTQITARLKLKECTVGEGAFCGPTKVDRSFITFLKSKMGHHYESLALGSEHAILKEFAEIKRRFGNKTHEAVYTLSLPEAINIPEADIRNGELSITREEIRALFDPVVTEVITFLYNQIKDFSERAGRCCAIFLVGSGFEGSLYFYDRIVEWAGPYGIEVAQPRSRSAITAAVRGAVIKGVEDALNPESSNTTPVSMIPSPTPWPESNIAAQRRQASEGGIDRSQIATPPQALGFESRAESAQQGPRTELVTRTVQPPKPQKPTRLLKAMGNIWK
ncbi:hypothetical protein TWF506_010802 [Arthrobotrys conoides]|uniref:Uncharacterized protein n=1 Tax=Arthrobotrys conoides TaxID=74498 RepID=A0AAN8RSK2_9PEZI